VDLPLPIAVLLRRARNAKSPKERHDTAYFAWEASVRLAVAARPPRDPAPLARAPLGRWVAALTPPEEPLAGPAPLAAFALFAEAAEGRRAAPRAVSPRRLLDALPAYRNEVIGHGAVRAPEFYDQAAEALLAGLEATWEAGAFWPAGARLVYVTAPGARLRDLAGLAPREGDGDAPADAAAGRLYARAGGALLPLHPWLLYEESELGERVLFFNGIGGSPRYLDYVSGEQRKGEALLARFPSIRADLLAVMGEVKPDPAEVEKAADPALFGDYRVLGPLGEGGMGAVYLARQETLAGRLVALKMLPPAADATAAARFRREIAALSRCDHANVVKILASGEAQGRAYYAMELVEGADLAEVARALGAAQDLDAAISSAGERVRAARAEAFAAIPDLPQSRAAPAFAAGRAELARRLAAIFRDAARALHYLHERGIVHRDVKPGNLMVTAGEHRVVVMDLGLAALGDASRSLTKDRGFVGTLRYAAPEQLERREAPLDRRADVYALGATLYELATGRPVFDGASEARLLEQVARERPLAPRRANPRLPRDLGVIIEKALEKDPARRHDTAEALARDLEAFLEGRPIAARPPTVGYLVGLAVRRNKAAAAFAAALVALAVGAAPLVLFVRDRAARAAREAAVETARARVAETRAEAGPAGARLNLAIRHAQAAAALRALAGDDPAARRAYFDAELALGRVALETAQWRLATDSFFEAKATGVDDDAAAAALAEARAAETRVAREHREAVEKVLAEARLGKALEQPDRREDALFALVQYSEPQTVSLVAAALDAVTLEIRAVEREKYLEAATPTADEAAAGAVEIAGLGPALDIALAADPLAKLPTPAAALLGAAGRRLEERAARRKLFNQRPPSIDLLLAEAEEARLPAQLLLFAQLACNALRRIGIAEGAEGALARYLFAERDEPRAAAAAVALLALGAEHAERLATVRGERFDLNGAYWRQVLPHFGIGPGGRLAVESALGYDRRATVRLAQGDVEGAIADYTRAIELAPASGGLFQNRSVARRRRGDLDGALEDANRAVELMPASAAAWSIRGTARFAKRDFDGAIVDFTRAIELDPRVPLGWNNRGNARKVRRDFEGAAADYGRAIELDPRYARAFYNRGLVRKEQGDLDRAIEDLSRAIEIDPGYVGALGARSDCLRLKGDLVAALADARRAVETAPQSSRGWYARGCVRRAQGDFEGSIADLSRAIDLEPGVAEIWGARAKTRWLALDVEGTLADATRAIELDPGLGTAYALRGLAHLRKGAREEAIRDCDRGVALAPQNASTWGMRALVRHHQGDGKGAIEDFTRAIELEPRDAIWVLDRALVLYEDGDLAGAIADCSKSLELDPRGVEALLWRGRARRQAGDLDGALADCERAIEIAPTVARAWEEAAAARLAKGDRAGAIAGYTRAIELDPRSSGAWRGRGIARAEAGERAGAIEDLERFFLLAAPDDPTAPEARAKLAELQASGL
jgi:tetratricopeptide (TPR) repeat protein/serine/threonine protein kinase